MQDHVQNHWPHQELTALDLDCLLEKNFEICKWPLGLDAKTGAAALHCVCTKFHRLGIWGGYSKMEPLLMILTTSPMMGTYLQSRFNSSLLALIYWKALERERRRLRVRMLGLSGKLSVTCNAGGNLVVGCSSTTKFWGKVVSTRTRFAKVSFVLPTHKKILKSLLRRVCHP